VRFFLTQLDGFAASCGGLVLFDDYAEIKRLCHVGQDYRRFWSRFGWATSAPNALKFKHSDFEHAKLLTSKADERDKAHSTSNTISPQQERTKPSGAPPCRHGVKLPPQREPAYQEICYVVIQAQGLSFSTILGKIS
jgi:hypothetical protein